MSNQSGPSERPSPRLPDIARLHLQVGWWSLLVFLAFGLFLESLHGLKTSFYLDVSNSTRRLMWSLAHAHGALFSILNVLFAMSLSLVPRWTGARRTIASRCFLGALILVPLGFFLGGMFIYGGDPGVGVLLTWPGGLLLIIAVFLTARAFVSTDTTITPLGGDEDSGPASDKEEVRPRRSRRGMP